jgi:hypothetical protein
MPLAICLATQHNLAPPVPFQPALRALRIVGYLKTAGEEGGNRQADRD